MWRCSALMSIRLRLKTEMRSCDSFSNSNVIWSAALPSALRVTVSSLLQHWSTCVCAKAVWNRPWGREGWAGSAELRQRHLAHVGQADAQRPVVVALEEVEVVHTQQQYHERHVAGVLRAEGHSPPQGRGRRRDRCQGGVQAGCVERGAQAGCVERVPGPAARCPQRSSPRWLPAPGSSAHLSAA